MNPPPLYNHYTLDRRTLSHPDPLDRRTLVHPDILDRHTLSHPDPLDRRTLVHPDLLDRRTLVHPDLLDRRTLAHPDLLDRRTLAQQSIALSPLDRRTLAHPESVFDRHTIIQPDGFYGRTIAQTDSYEKRTVADPDGLERRTIALSDGTVRSYYALPSDPPPWPTARVPHVISQLPHVSQLISLSQHSHKEIEKDGIGVSKSEKDRTGVSGVSGVKRKNEDEDARILKREKTEIKDKEESEKEKDKGKAPPLEVDKKSLLEAFLKFSKLINENSTQKNIYLSNNGKNNPLHCLVCGRESKEFKDVRALVMHAYYSMKLLTEHRGLHKALCVLLGLDPNADPKNSKIYQQGLSDERAQANRDDLIIWPPIVVIQNTNSSSKKEGRLEGMGNKEIDSKLLDLGFKGGKAKCLFGKEGHQGVTLVKFADTPAGLKEADRLSEFFQKTGQGRKNWGECKNNNSKLGDLSGKNKALVKAYESGENRVLYGYLAIASDLEIFDSDAKKSAVVKSRKSLLDK